MKFNYSKLFIVSLLFTSAALAQEGSVRIQKSGEIDRVLTLKKELNKEKEFIRIQIFSGERLEAESTLKGFKSDFPEQTVEMKYETPNYKIWIGKFKTRLEADRELRVVKKSYPAAFRIIP
jgi:hypothetical protein